MSQLSTPDICNICPRNCNVNRDESTGFCKMTNHLKIARAALHMWEEPCISGDKGSGTVFFTGCNLRCIFCQNTEIAAGLAGKEISVDRLVEIFFELKEKGAANINLVTPSHYVYQIREALSIAKEKGLNLPIVYNTSSYESAETLRLLDGLIDIYLPDLKYFDSTLAKELSAAPNYFSIATEAIAEMYRQVKDPVFEDNYMKKGVIVRHLLLPGHVKDSKEIINYLYNTYHDHIYISIMNQYTPMKHFEKFPSLNRKVTKREYDSLVDYAIDLGVENGFIQEGETSDKSFIPPFNYEGV